MAVTKSESFGCVFKFGDWVAGLLAEADQTVSQVISLDGPEWSMDVTNVTTNDSAGLMEYLAAGIADGGEMAVGVILDPTNAVLATLIGYIEAGTKLTLSITFTGDADTCVMGAIGTRFKIVPGPQDGTADALKAELGFKITDDISLAVP